MLVFTLLSVATRKFKITHVVGHLFLLDGADVEAQSPWSIRTGSVRIP